MSTLSNQDSERYDRQISIQGLGREGQQKLKEAHITVAGMGGLGSVVSIYLAVAGIGHLTVIDPDVVELSNLNRQILYWEKDIGEKKVKSAAEKLAHFNSGVEVTGMEESINKNNVLDLLQDADAIIDCLDNFPTRYILNDAALKLNIPLFHGACSGFEGRVSTIIPGMTACLRCVFPKGPPEEKVPIIGTTPGTVGTIQATEVIKFLVGIEPLLTNRLLIYDGQFLTYDLINVKRNPECAGCGGGCIK